MRLTLRTLLAYLDDTLEPAEARQIGQKIAESEQARDLIERIQQVTHRRRITTPPAGGPGGMLDPNTIGEYLDNTITPEQAGEVESIFLASDAHLAEIAACHQILTLILGEPALVPPSAKQRMYGLVKGPEAIPFRKPPATSSKGEFVLPESRTMDNTLRMGIPPVSGKSRGNPWLLVAGAGAAACLLAVAVWQILNGPREPRPDANNPAPAFVQVDPNKDKAPSVDDKKGQVEDKRPMQDDQQPMQDDKKKGKKETTKDPIDVKLPPVIVDVPWTPPSDVVQSIGRLVVDAKDPDILLVKGADKAAWQRIGPDKPVVTTGQALVSVPLATSVVHLKNGIQLTLVGCMFPEMIHGYPLYESSVELHVHDQLDLDVTLRRGRIRVLAPARPVRIRIRYDNPTQPNQVEYFDLVLQKAGTEVLVERWFLPAAEKYFADAKDVNREGPSAHLACAVLAGSVLFKANDATLSFRAPPGPAFITWHSRQGLDEPRILKEFPEEFVQALQPILPGMDPRLRAEFLKARDDLQQKSLIQAIDVLSAERLKASDLATRLLAVYCLSAVDDITRLYEQLDQEAAPELRVTAIEMLRHWLAASRDHDGKLFDFIKTKFKAGEAENLVTLLHDFGPKDLKSPDTYELLINYLNHPQVPLRELAAWQLYRIVPGQKIPYRVSGDAAIRQHAQAAWRMVIPPGQLPPTPKKK